MGYSTDEKDAAVLRIVQGNPTFPRSSLATRRVDETYAQVAELVQSAFLYEPDSVFYLSYLSSNYYLRSLRTMRGLTAELLDYIDDLLKPNRAIDDVSALSVARRALDAIDGAIDRQGSISAAAWSRYDAAIVRSRDSIGAAVKLNYTPRGSSSAVTDIVRPRDEARSLIVRSFSSLKTSHSDLIDNVGYLIDGLPSYLRGDVATTVAKRQIKRAKSDLQDLHDVLSPLSPKGRITEARDALLRILANRGAVSRLADTAEPGAPKLSGSYRVRAYGNGTPPAVTGSVSAPWRIESGVADVLAVDVGGTSVSVDLVPGSGYDPGIEAAEVLGAGVEPFGIGAGLSAPHPLLTAEVVTDYDIGGKTLYLIVDGTRYEITFTSGNKTPTQVAAAINGSAPVLATPMSGGGFVWVQIEYDVASPPSLNSNRYMTVASGVNDAVTNPGLSRPLGPIRVDTGSGVVTASTSRGWDDTTKLRVVPNDNEVTPSQDYVEVDLTPGDWPSYERSAAQLAADISSGGSTEFEGGTDNGRVVVRSKVLGSGSAIRIVSAGPGTPSYRGMTVLGFLQDQEDKSGDVWSQTLLNVVGQDTGFSAVATVASPRQVLLKARAATVTASNQLSVSVDAANDPSQGWVLSGVKLVVNSGDNAGVYGISSTSWSAPTLNLVLDRNLRDRTAANRHLITVIEEHITITSRDGSTSAYIEVGSPPGSAHTVLGLATTRVYGTVQKVLVETQDPVLGWVVADISRNGIRVGDLIIDGSGVETEITSVVDAGSGILGVVGVDPSFSLTSFTVESAAARLHDDFVTALTAWVDDLAPFNDLQRIDRILAPILIIDEPSTDQVDAAYNIVQSYDTKLAALESILSSFVVPQVPVVDDAIRTLLEHGHDRARELLLQSRFDDFFSVTARTASYGRNLMAAAASVAVQDINEPTKHRAENEGEFERYRGGFIDDHDPGMEFSNEADLPSVPLESYWPDEV